MAIYIKTRWSIFIAILLLFPALSSWAGDLDTGKEALEAGRIDQALDLLQRAVDSEGLDKPTRAEAYYALGRAFEAKGYWPDAERSYGWALALAGTNRTYLKAFRRMRRLNSPGSP